MRRCRSPCRTPRSAPSPARGGPGEIVAIAQPHHVERFLRRQHRAMAGSGMIGMAVGDDRALDRPYRIDMEAAGLAAESGGDGHQNVLRAHAPYIGPIAPTFSQGTRA